MWGISSNSVTESVSLKFNNFVGLFQYFHFMLFYIYTSLCFRGDVVFKT